MELIWSEENAANVVTSLLIMAANNLFLTTSLIFQLTQLNLSLLVFNTLMISDLIILLKDHFLLHLSVQLLVIESGAAHSSQRGTNDDQLETHFQTSSL